MSNLKLGRLPKRTDERTLQLKKYLAPDIQIPSNIDYYSSVTDWKMFLNDRLGCCAIASPGHMIEAWKRNNVDITDAMIEKAYSDVSGYDPATGNNDNGCDMLSVQTYWRKTGIGKHITGAYAEVDYTNEKEILTALYLFEGVDIGVNLPQSAMDQFNAGQPWTVSGDNTILGGHSICIVGYDGTWYYIVTWGALVKVDPKWMSTYMDESYVEIANDYITGGKTLEGFDVATLVADLKAISDGTYNVDPNIIPQPTPTPPIPVPPHQESWWQLIVDWFKKSFGRKPVSREEAKDEFQKYIGSL